MEGKHAERSRDSLLDVFKAEQEDQWARAEERAGAFKNIT